MTYELAKQLKEAGFEQRPYKDNNYLSAVGVPKKIFVDEFPDEAVYNPSLSELIEACGEGFGELQREKDEVGEVIWYATHRGMNDMTQGYAKGKTPEEAVAKLYIKIYG